MNVLVRTLCDLSLQLFGEEDLRRAAVGAIDEMTVLKLDGLMAADAGSVGHLRRGYRRPGVKGKR